MSRFYVYRSFRANFCFKIFQVSFLSHFWAKFFSGILSKVHSTCWAKVFVRQNFVESSQNSYVFFRLWAINSRQCCENCKFMCLEDHFERIVLFRNLLSWRSENWQIREKKIYIPRKWFPSRNILRRKRKIMYMKIRCCPPVQFWVHPNGHQEKN